MKSSKIFLNLVLVVACVGFFLGGCTKKETTDQAPKKLIGLVLDKGGKDDKSFNSAAVEGTQRALKEIPGIELKDVECPDDASYEPALRALAERGASLVIAIGFSQKDAVTKVAAQFPKVHFALVDAVVDLPNVQSVLFAEHVGSYVVGHLAGLASKSQKIGFIGGMDTPLIRRFQLGYEAGVTSASKKAKVSSQFIGVTSDAWANPNRAKEIALQMVSQGVDVIFVAAGASNMGAFDVAEEKSIFAIGVDSNQNWVKPGRILTSMLKRVDQAVLEVIKTEVDGKFVAGKKTLGLEDKGIDYAVDSHNQELIKPYVEKLEAIKKDIISGKIKVPDYYEKIKL